MVQSCGSGKMAKFFELRRDFPAADQVGRFTVFNIAGNHYRLIARVEFQRQRICIRAVLTHPEYDTGHWKDDEWFDYTPSYLSRYAVGFSAAHHYE
jgi:hypothetical protein